MPLFIQRVTVVVGGYACVLWECMHVPLFNDIYMIVCACTR